MNYTYFNAEYTMPHANTSNVTCISEFNVLESCTISTTFNTLYHMPHDNCVYSLFDTKVDNETCINATVLNGKSIKFQIWKLTDLVIASGGIIKIYNGKNRILRFANKYDNSNVSVIKIQHNNVGMFVPKEILYECTIEVVENLNIERSIVVNLNLFLYEIKSSFGKLVGTDDTCPICLDAFNPHESVFYSHDKMHPLCTNCAFTLIRSGINKCPLCRTDIILT